MVHADLNSFDTIVEKGIITQLYTVNGQYIECWTDDVQAQHCVEGEEFYPSYFLGWGLKLGSELEADFLLQTGDLTSSGGVRNNMLYSVQQSENFLTQDDFQYSFEYEAWLDLYNQHMTIQSYIVS